MVSDQHALRNIASRKQPGFRQPRLWRCWRRRAWFISHTGTDISFAWHYEVKNGNSPQMHTQTPVLATAIDAKENTLRKGRIKASDISVSYRILQEKTAKITVCMSSPD
jgi:hypothetical protein